MKTFTKTVFRTSEERIFEKYHAVAMTWGTELLFRRQDALHFIDDCKQSRLTILGLDFYREVGETIVPLLHSADYSALHKKPNAVRKSTSAARQLIKNGFPDGVAWVSFVIRTASKTRSSKPRNQN
jgi:hypothetical protein